MNKKGFTLVELVVSLALLTLVISLAFTMLSTSIRAQNASYEDVNLQSSGRLVSQTINQVVRYSSALFTIQKSKFTEANLTDGWDYIGLSADQTEIVRYAFNGSTHDKTVIVPSQPSITYQLKFVKVDKDNNNKMLSFEIEAIKNGVSLGRVDINTQLEALNALQVIDRGTLSDPATAIAYRDDKRPFATVGTIAMVLDTSGSMKEDVIGHDTSNSLKEKINILKIEAKKMVDEFAKEDNIYIATVPFESSANGTYGFVNVKSASGTLIDQIDHFDAFGGTNTGDGMRRAYYTLKNYNEQPSLDVTPKNFMIILVDGETTYASYNFSSHSYITNDGNISTSSNLLGDGNSSTPNVKAYDQQIGQIINNYANDIKVYMISFSTETSLYANVVTIGTYAGATSDHIFAYSPTRDLGAIFSTIRQDILNDLWVINGPA